MPLIHCKRCGTHRQTDGLGILVEICAKCVKQFNLQLFNRLSQEQGYQGTTVERLPQQAYRKAMAWAYGDRGLMLEGPSGTGKTRIMWEVLEQLITGFKAEMEVCVFDCVSFGHELSRAYRREEAEDWLDHVSKATIVAFDDLGKEKLTERVESELFGVVDRRVRLLRPIIATAETTNTNLTTRLTSHRGPALVRRLKEACTSVHVP